MKILIVAGGFLPAKKYGGPVVSIDNLCSLLKDEAEMYVIADDHDNGESKRLEGIKEGWNQRSNCSVYYLKPQEVQKDTLMKIYDDISPDLIYINSFFDYSLTVPFLKIAKQRNCKVLLAPRGQLCAGAFKKKFKKIPYIVALQVLELLKNVHYQSTSDEETAAIQKWLGAHEDQVHFLTNIPSIPDEGSFQKTEKKPGSARLIYISRIVEKKNLLYAIECLKAVKGNVEYDIYGPLEDPEYWKKCEDAAASLPANIQVKYCGMVDHEDIHRVFSGYDAFFFPTQSENFGHVLAESFAAGCPVIVSDQTPWLELQEQKVGWDIPLDQNKKFTDAIQNIVDMGSDAHLFYRENCKTYFQNKMQLNHLKLNYMSVFKEITDPQ